MIEADISPENLAWAAGEIIGFGVFVTGAFFIILRRISMGFEQKISTRQPNQHETLSTFKTNLGPVEHSDSYVIRHTGFRPHHRIGNF
jgi:hypothetical protein